MPTDWLTKWLTHKTRIYRSASQTNTFYFLNSCPSSICIAIVAGATSWQNVSKSILNIFKRQEIGWPHGAVPASPELNRFRSSGLPLPRQSPPAGSKPGRTCSHLCFKSFHFYSIYRYIIYLNSVFIKSYHSPQTPNLKMSLALITVYHHLPWCQGEAVSEWLAWAGEHMSPLSRHHH